MFSHFHLRPWATHTRAAIAQACAFAVVVLGVLSLRPDLHAHVHHDAHEASHGCAVVLYAGGIEPVSTEQPCLAPRERVNAVAALTAPSLQLEQPARLRPPGRAPPRA